MCYPLPRNLVALFSCACLCSVSGCSLFRADLPSSAVVQSPSTLPGLHEQSNLAPPADPLAVGPQNVGEGAGAASCFVEIRALGKEPKRIRMSLDDAVYVQKVLEQTGLVKEFKAMDIELSRKLPDGTRHKLDIRYNAKKNHVVSAFDYALHPNDLLVVREESATSLDDMLKKLAGPLAR